MKSANFNTCLPHAPYSHAAFSPFGGWNAFDINGHAMQRPRATYGDIPPRFRTAKAAEVFGRKRTGRP